MIRVIPPRRRFSKNNTCVRFLSKSRFEEKKMCRYLINLINSKFLIHKPYELLSISSEILGKDKITPLFKNIPSSASDNKKHAVSIHRNEICAEGGETDRYREIPKQDAIRFLKETILPMLNKRIERLSRSHEDGLERRLLSVQDTFKLSDEDTDILLFYYLLSVSQILSSYMKDGSFSRRFTGNLLADFSSYISLRSYGHIVLGINQRSFIKTLVKGKLLEIQLLTITRDDSGIEINDWCKNYLMGVSKKKIEHEFFSMENNVSLDISDFDLTGDELLVLSDLLRGKDRCNILLYGAPGTGKTSLAKVLARIYGKELLTVKIPEDESDSQRILSVYATVNMAQKDDSVILVDEAEELLTPCDPYRTFANLSPTKARINSFLDSHDKKIIWITNRIKGIDLSTMRRFSFSMEFNELTAKRRLTVLKYELKKKGFENFFTDKELSDLSRNYTVDAGSIANAMNTLRPNKTQKKATVIRKIRAILESCEKVIKRKRVNHIKNRSFEQYSLEGLGTSHNLCEIINILKQYSEVYEKDNAAPSMALLLYGLPGTGKTEFVHYLGSCLEKEVILKRCSEIQSMWVGETEKNIADAFWEAHKSKDILFFDEADSFLFPRISAQHSWETSFTNELLSQLDNYAGIVVFATNNIDGLDHAALRRFKFKIEFQPLTADGNLRFYNAMLRHFVISEADLSLGLINQIKGLINLTPGDFTVVKEQFLFADKTSLTHERLIEALRGESAHKKNFKAVVGFIG
ncbi:MAG: ATP-binding protein [Nitrospirae bacterium]|nr:ATP-binding protein [Nitrospirota bacterium]